MAAYLIKSILCLLVLWGFYKVALEQTAAHRFKRFYLLGSLIVSLTLPLLTFSYTVQMATPDVVETANTYYPTGYISDIEPAAIIQKPIDYTSWILGLIYILGFLLFGFRFAKNIRSITKKVMSNEKIPEANYTYVLLDNTTVPHSFLKYIFLSKSEFINNKIAPEILAHEKAHVDQKHSWDILFIELLQVAFWFNPLLHFHKKCMALNHEFLADASVLDENISAEKYTQLLFQYSVGAHHTPLSSPINYSLTKKRILMLSKTRSVKKLATRLALFVPVLALCVYFFNQEIVAKPVKIQEEKQEKQKTTKKETPPTTTLKTSSSSEKPTIITQAELNAISKNPTFSILPKKIPSDSQIKDWKNASQYGVWVDGKRIENKDLKDPDTYSLYFISKLEKNAKNYGKHYFQVNLMTSDYYETHKKIQDLPTLEEIKEYRKQKEKKLHLKVTGSQVWLNSKETSVKNFVKTINEITKDWTKSDMMNYSINVQTKNGVDKVISALSKEFKKTNLYKINPSRELIPPPPPAPAAPTAPVAGQLPPPPPPAPPILEGKLPPPPPPAPLSPESFNKNEYNLLNIRLSNTEAIEVEGKKTTISKVQNFIEKNFKSWTEDNNDKPRGVLFHLPEGVSESQAQKTFKEIQDFKINTFVVQKEGSKSKIPVPPALPSEDSIDTPQTKKTYLKNRKAVTDYIEKYKIKYPLEFLNLSKSQQETFLKIYSSTSDSFMSLDADVQKEVPKLLPPPPSADLYKLINGKLVKKENKS